MRIVKSALKYGFKSGFGAMGAVFAPPRPYRYKVSTNTDRSDLVRMGKDFAKAMGTLNSLTEIESRGRST